jgi:hypothetical protein
LFILPGQSVPITIMDNSLVHDATVTTMPKAFMNGTLFVSWLKFFSDAVPAEVKRPLLLIIDGCSSHISMEVVDESAHLQIRLVALPANATHLLQPLNVAVFGSFKENCGYSLKISWRKLPRIRSISRLRCALRRMRGKPATSQTLLPGLKPVTWPRYAGSVWASVLLSLSETERPRKSRQSKSFSKTFC